MQRFCASCQKISRRWCCIRRSTPFVPTEDFL
jgi:hypothetical protein